jgi:hypothetical protein
MFSLERKPFLEFQVPFTERKHFLCPRCKTESSRGDETISLMLETTEDRIKLSRPVNGLEQLFEIPWFKEVHLSGNEDLFEAIIFELESGKTRLTLENKNGVPLDSVSFCVWSSK